MILKVEEVKKMRVKMSVLGLGSKVILIPVVIIGMFVSARGVPSRPVADQQPIRLISTDWFQLPEGPSTGLVGFEANAHGLYFLLVGQEQVTVVRTDGTGVVERRFSQMFPDLSSSSFLMDVSGQGEVALVRQGSKASDLFMYDAEGVLRRKYSLNSELSAVEFVGETLVGFNEDSGLLTREPAGSPLLSLGGPLRWPCSLVSLSAGMLAVIEESVPRVRIVEPLTGKATTAAVNLQAPEIQGYEPKDAPPNLAEQVFYTAAAGPGYSLFGAASPYRRAKGANVLQFDRYGQLLSRYRCLLPVFEELKSEWNPEGNMAANRVGVVADTIYVVDQQSKRCARYRLPAKKGFIIGPGATQFWTLRTGGK